MAVAMAVLEMSADRPGDVATTVNGERAALAEVVLDINDDQCAHGANGILRIRET